MEPSTTAEYQQTDLFTDAEWTALASHFGFTKRQRDIAEHIGLGESQAVIARRLRNAPDTVHTHPKEVFRKAGVKN